MTSHAATLWITHRPCIFGVPGHSSGVWTRPRGTTSRSGATLKNIHNRYDNSKYPSYIYLQRGIYRRKREVVNNMKAEPPPIQSYRSSKPEGVMHLVRFTRAKRTRSALKVSNKDHCPSMENAHLARKRGKVIAEPKNTNAENTTPRPSSSIYFGPHFITYLIRHPRHADN